IKQNANRAAGLVRQLLAFSRQQTLRPQVLQLGDVLSELSILLGRLLGENIELTLDQAGDLWPVKADLHQFEQVIINLAVNARDAMPDGGKLTIRTANVGEEESRSLGHPELVPGEYVSIEVKDTGCGIPKEIQEKIFEPFFTTKGARSGSAVKGTGLGLSVSYSIIRNHDGSIEVESEVGVGTTFTIKLPVITSEPEESKIPTPTVVSRQDKGTLDILVVDDEEVIRTILKRLLSKEGHHVTTTADGVSALQLLPKNNFDLIFSDISMPRMSGIEFLEKVKSLNCKAKVIMITGQIIDTDLERAQKKGAWGYLRKPFQKADLDEIIRKAMQHS
ncbi:MAG: response regulator, partial [candidate division KSB1 bacterium]|nr:response regulator [candidate division KSB1 bacterium]